MKQFIFLFLMLGVVQASFGRETDLRIRNQISKISDAQILIISGEDRLWVGGDAARHIFNKMINCLENINEVPAQRDQADISKADCLNKDEGVNFTKKVLNNYDIVTLESDLRTCSAKYGKNRFLGNFEKYFSFDCYIKIP